MRVETLGWSEHWARWDWRQGEHVTCIGPTGQGKTFLIRHILPKRQYVIFVATKPQDSTIDELEADGFKVVRKWEPKHDRMVLYPIRRKSAWEDKQMSKEEIGRMLGDVYVQGGWTVVLDELKYVTDTLKLSSDVELLWLQGRSMGVSVVSGAQRPRHVPLAAYSQARHLYLWRTRDKGDVKRLAEFSGEISAVKMSRLVSELPDHACLYAHADGTLYRTGVGMERQIVKSR